MKRAGLLNTGTLAGALSWLLTLGLLASPAFAQTFVDDRALTVTTPSLAAQKRQALIDHIWGASAGFPAAKMPAEVRLDDISPIAGLPNLGRVDTFITEVDTVTVTTPDGSPGSRTFRGYAHHFVPLVAGNRRLVVLHLGHGMSFDDDPAPIPGQDDPGMERTLAALLAHGYSVLAVYMPGRASFPTALRPPLNRVVDIDGHADIFNVPPATGTAVKRFLEPTAVALNYLKARAGSTSSGYPFPRYHEYDMVGLSGGGWTTTLYAAVDPTIKISIPVAGTLPLYMRNPVPDPTLGIVEGDEEQTNRALYSVAGYKDLYALGAFGSGRAQVQVLNRHDPCCFGWTVFRRPSPFTYDEDIRAYEADVQQALAGINAALPGAAGTFRVSIENETRMHQISTTTLVRDILGALQPIVSLTASRTFPSPAGAPITWNAAANGGIGPYEFQYHLADAAVGWRIVRDFAADPTFTWTPAVPGNYALQVWVRPAGWGADYHGYAASGLFSIGPGLTLTIDSFATDRRLPVPAGTPVVWTAHGSGGVTPIQYKFWGFDPDRGWSVLQEYSANNSLVWTPRSTGQHALQVWVRSAGSTASYEAYAASGLLPVAPGPPRIVSLTSNAVFPVAPTTPVRWTAVGAGGDGPLEYEFYLYGHGAWTLVRAYDQDPAWTWTPTATDTVYRVHVRVREAGSVWNGVAYGDSDWLTVESGPAELISLTTNQPFPATTSTTITWTARARRGAAPIEYRFWLYSRESTLWTSTPWSPQHTFTWAPARGDFGLYVVQVWVRSSGSSAAYESWISSGYFLIRP